MWFGATNHSTASVNNGTPQVIVPTFSPSAGTYVGSQTVSISTATGGATIHYTTDGSTPTSGSATYSTPITVSASETVKAIGILGGYTNSNVASAAYVITSSGALTITSSATPPNATNGGAYFYPVTASGGSPPYHWGPYNYAGSRGNWSVADNGWISGAPTSTGTDTFTLTVKDSTGASTTQSVTITVDNVLVLAAVDLGLSQINLPPAIVGNKYNYQLAAYGGTSPYTYTVSVGSLPAGLSMTGGLITGTPTGSGTTTLTLKVTDNVSATATSSASITVAASSSVSRPAYNSTVSNGFFVLNGKLYDPNGYEFRIRGLNRNHYDSNTWVGPACAAKTATNAARWFMYLTDGSIPVSTYVTELNDQYIANGILPIITMAIFPNGNATSGNASPSDLTNGVNWWVSNSSAFAPYMEKMAINIANEWGPSNSTTWRDSYKTAVSSLRSAGYTCPIVIDAGGSGQDAADIVNYASAIQANDSLRNCVFSYHSYGLTTNTAGIISGITKASGAVVTLNYSLTPHPFDSLYTNPGDNTYTGITSWLLSGVGGMTAINGTQPSGTNGAGGSPSSYTLTLTVDSSGFGAYTSGGQITPASYYTNMIGQFAALQSSNICVIIGEFGPGQNIGPSPTTTSPYNVIATAEANGLGWVYWAWDDHVGSPAFTGWFGCTINNTGAFSVNSDLTAPGLDSCFNPRYGLVAFATKASVFL